MGTKTLSAIQSLAKAIYHNQSEIVSGAADTLPRQWGFHTWLAQPLVSAGKDLEDWPKSIYLDYLENESRVSLMQHEFQRLASVLDKKSFEYGLIKGLWLSQKVLPQPGLRLFHDVDLWVSPEAYKEMDAIMTSLGFKSIDKNHHYFHFHKAYQIQTSGLKLTFEIHKALSLDDFIKIDHNEVWASANRTSGTSQIEFQPAHQLIYSFCHNSLHCFDRPSRFMDLPLIFSWAQRQGVSEDELMAIMDSWKCRRLFLFSLVALHWLIGEQPMLEQFTEKEVQAAKHQFQLWLKGFTSEQRPSKQSRRFHLSDSPARAFYGFVHPKRILGALVDRLGIY